MKSPFNNTRPESLLAIDHDPKTIKGRKQGYLTGILYLHPHKAYGFNVCPNAEAADCVEPCLNKAGRGAFDKTQDARLRKTWLFHYEREWFMDILFSDIAALQRKAQRQGLIPAVRLNGTSDLDWESIRYKGESSMERFSLVQHYDYTKLPRTPKNNNYHLTFSYSASPAYARTVAKAMRLEMNIAVVSRDPAPATFLNRKVVSGEESDLTFLQPQNSVLWLKAKGKARTLESDLIVRAA